MKKPKQNALRRHRHIRQFTLEQIALALGVRQQTVHGWEIGRRRPNTSAQASLSRLLGVQVSELFP